MYALGVTPLIRTMSLPQAQKHAWITNDATAGGILDELSMWWDQVADKDVHSAIIIS